jgi:hypothetical protein
MPDQTTKRKVELACPECGGDIYQEVVRYAHWHVDSQSWVLDDDDEPELFDTCRLCGPLKEEPDEKPVDETEAA